MASTLAQKIWRQHVVHESPGDRDLLYIDAHLLHEVTSPQAFEGLELRQSKVRRPELCLAMPDHNIPTRNPGAVEDETSRQQLAHLYANCEAQGIECFKMDDARRGIVHVAGPEQGFILPGMTAVCGDSHTATHGAFGALAFGIGTAEVEQVLATQALWQSPQKQMRVVIDGEFRRGVSVKDLILHIVGQVGNGGATGHIVEYAGALVRSLSMEARMTLCNMTIEMGARAGLVAPDARTLEYLKGKTYAPSGADWQQALAFWQTLKSDPDARWDKELRIDVTRLSPQITWGTNPEDVIAIDSAVPVAQNHQSGAARATTYMGLEGITSLSGLEVDLVFIGSCTNGRLEDLQVVAGIVAGQRVAPHVRAIIVPGSQQVKQEAEALGLARIFIEAGFEWRDSGCSMCCGMNEDRLGYGQRAVSTSNRNFENRQGRGGRTHLASPATAALTAIRGVISSTSEQ